MMQLLRPSSWLLRLPQWGNALAVPAAFSGSSRHQQLLETRPCAWSTRGPWESVSSTLAAFTTASVAPHPTKMACAEVVLVPTLADNYAYLFIDRKTRTAGCVDPAEPEKVIKAAKEHGVKLSVCLCTHKHLDHSGGNTKIRSLVPGLEVVGSAYEDVPGRTKAVKDGDTMKIGDLDVKVLHSPCHTMGHVLYYMESRSDPNAGSVIFTGDTLFCGGCGRFFEGDAASMHRALNTIISGFVPSTLVYCGHEYTVSNLKFAVTIEPDNESTSAKLRWALEQRAAGKPTIPSTIGEEQSYNPFMRVHKPEVQRAVGAPAGDAIQTMHILRERKNMFKG